MPASTMQRARVRTAAMALVVIVAGTAARGDGEASQIRAEPVRTGKERLGGKASDEQRVDNCKVRPDLRGPKPRPDQCGGDAAGAER